MSQLLVVAVPGGSTRDGTVVRAVLVPRLDGAATLESHGLADWPDLLRRSTITLRHSADAAAPETELAVSLRPQADSALWSRMFTGVPVRPWRTPAAYPDPTVAPTAAQVTTVQGIYANAALAGGGADTVAAQLDAVPDAAPEPPRVPPGPARRGEEPDFHRLVTLFREHPAVLRALGLILELDIPDPAPLRAAAAGVIRLDLALPADAPPDLTVDSPRTHFAYAGNRFVPAPREGSDLRLGLVDLAADPWKVATFDAVGSMDRLRLAKAKTASGGAATLPALRSTGLSLLQAGRETVLRARNQAASVNATVPSAADLELWADDLVLGYRVDVRAADGNWTSVCRRVATYRTGDRQVQIGVTGEEEGHVKANGASVRGVREDDGTFDLVADETVVRWDGWSMVCPQPRLLTRRAPAPAGAEAGLLSWDFAPVELPRLRFGTSYRMRLRVADLAGGGLTPDDPDQTEAATPPAFYGRHDPVPPPELPPPPGLVADPGDALGPGGLLDVVVIRSDPGEPDALDVEQYAAAHPYPANDTRMLLPPPAAFVLCRESGALDRLHDGEHRVDPDAEVPGSTYTQWIRRGTSPPAYTPDGRYSWLPDPSAQGVTLYGRPDPAGPAPGEPASEAWRVPTGAWPDFLPKTVRLVARLEGEKPVDWKDAQTAFVRLAPAESLTVEVSSSVADEGLFAMTNWLGTGAGLAHPLDPANADVLDKLRDLVRAGRHPLVSPARTVRFVHAVQHPLTAPGGTLVAGRQEGETSALLADPDPRNALLGLHAPSTAQVDVEATWPEWDPMGADAPAGQRTHKIGTYALDAAARGLPEIRHEFGDTRHRIVDYTLTANSRFRAYFQPGENSAFQRQSHFSVSVPSSARPAPPLVRAALPAFRWEDQSEGTRYRKVRHGGLIRVELAKPWHTTGEGEQLGVLVFSEAPTPVPVDARPYVSDVRRDPIHATPLPPAGLVAGMVTRAAGKQPITSHQVPYPFVLLAHDVHHQPESGQAGYWYADVGLDLASDSYSPFVQLAVVRFQRASVAGLEASSVVRTEPIPLMPDRTLTCSADASGIKVEVTGTGPAGSRPNLVRATIERVSPGADPDVVEATALHDGPDARPAWRTVHTVTGQLGTALTLPAVEDPGRCRLVVEEIEQFNDRPATSPLAERTVFLDVVRLPQLGL
ncbi:hypothetical protein [Amycolatopsis jejuensis]|uniref:hypothetical protein n=1 Tax=Amycolatopsis jejuensis TaxID=330084 RepID=UPI0005270037|nr:hypothetical protein [Amycolatopsis jejuensis]